MDIKPENELSRTVREGCPCSKHRCARWGNCEECRAFHCKKNSIVACERPPKEPRSHERVRTRTCGKD